MNGIQDDAVGGRRVVEAGVGERVVRTDADDAKEGEDLPVTPQQRQVVPDVRNRERRENQDGEEPAQERHRHRWDVAGQRAADDPVARPEERRQREQHRRVEAGDGSSGSMRRHRRIIACTPARIIALRFTADSPR